MTSRFHPITAEPLNGKPRQPLAPPEIPRHQRRPARPIDATYDAARSTDEHKNYWAHADHYDADSANSRAVRETLVSRSRYEVGNNGYADGMVQTYATDLVGKGPKRRALTGSAGFNQLVEMEFMRWAKAVLFRRKLWCAAHAKCQDGEAFLLLRNNPGVAHPVKLDVVPVETEQCQTPYLPWMAGYIDGVKFDDFGNPEWYDILQYHPGGERGYWPTMQPEQVPAKYVLHWYTLRRPGQHRGVPEFRSTLNSGASARRWREATLAAAENIADFSLFLQTGFQPEELDAVSPMSSLDIQKRMMTALPMGWNAFQPRAEQPTATHESFHKSLINEQARPKSMPYNKAACDSSSYNYASGRLDHQTYYGSIDVDREDGNDLVLDKLFPIWFDEAVRVFGWLGGDPAALSPQASAGGWDWPKHHVADIKAEAAANDTRLKNGSVSLSRLYSEAGEDFEDEVLVMAADYGVSVDEMRQILLRQNFPMAFQQQGAESGESRAREERDDQDQQEED